MAVPNTFSANTQIKSAQINQNFAYIDQVMPAGIIAMWSGSIASIPAAWALCDGTNGTPDLRDRFIVGAGSTYAVDATGGSADAVVVTHTHTQNAHTHTQNSHMHTVASHNNVNFTGTGQNLAGQFGGNSWNTGGTTATNQNTTATNQDTGVSGTNANLPPYYALAYIMKL